jgi:hypothetical protein
MIFLESGVAHYYENLTALHQKVVKNHLAEFALQRLIEQDKLFLFTLNRTGGQKFLGVISPD